MSNALFHILAFSITIPVVVGWIKFRQIVHQGYLPFFIYILFGFLNNLLSYLLIQQGVSNHINSNIYVLIAYILLLWQFGKWEMSHSNRNIILGFIGFAVWLADNFYFHSLMANNSIFRLFTSFTIQYLCILQFNKLIFLERNRIIRNPVFIISASLLNYYTFKSIIETFNFFSWLFESGFLIQLNFTLAFVDLITIIITTLALLCIRSKSTYYLY